jgi:hypothetical protein
VDIKKLAAAIDRAIKETDNALVEASKLDGHRAAQAKGQIHAALDTLHRARQFAVSSSSGAYSKIDPGDRNRNG